MTLRATEYECKVCGSVIYTLAGTVKHRLEVHGELMDESDVNAYYKVLLW